jgi:hypothetical protein
MTNTVKITARVEAESEAGARRVGEALLSMIDAGIVSGTGPCGEDGLYRLHLAEIPASVHAYLAEQLQGDARVASWDSEVVEAVCTCDALAPKPEDVPCRRKGCKAVPGLACATRDGRPHAMRVVDACDAVRQLCPVCVAKAKAASKPPVVYSSRGGAYNQPAPRRASDPFRLQGGR